LKSAPFLHLSLFGGQVDGIGTKLSLNPKAAKAGGLQIRRCQGLAVAYYGGILGALTLKSSGFCSFAMNPVEKLKRNNEEATREPKDSDY
jgi:hypothetical protein